MSKTVESYELESWQARSNPPERVRNPEDEKCECGGIKAWDEPLCEECQKIENQKGE